MLSGPVPANVKDSLAIIPPMIKRSTEGILVRSDIRPNRYERIITREADMII
jgi:hypothetical protein